MRKYFALFAAAATVLVAAASCAKENLSAAAGEEQMVEMTVIASEKPDANAAEATRTYLDGASVKWSASGEVLSVYQVTNPTGEGEISRKRVDSSEGVTEDSGATMRFSVTFHAVSDASFEYYAVYPRTSLYNTSDTETSVRMNTSATQSPSATSFDPRADLLIAKGIVSDVQPATLNMQFARLVAIGKMTVKNLESDDDITKISFSAKDDGNDVKIAGRTPFNLTTGVPTTSYGSGVAENTLSLDYAGKGIKANTSSGTVAYFTCYPFELSAGDSFTVVVETATHTFTKNVTLTGERMLVFKEGKSSSFSVDMDNITGVEKAVDLPYSCITYAEFHTLGVGDSYSNSQLTKTNGDRWQMYCLDNGSAIRIRKNDSVYNDSYIKLPDYSQDIKTVVVTLTEAASAYTLTLEDNPTSNSGTIATKSVAAGVLTHTFDIASAGVKTAFLRAKGAQASVAKVEVYSGDDTRAEFTAPASVTASLNEDDASVTNSIDVSWANVNEAGSYIVTLTPPSPAEPVSCECYGTSHTFENLLYETSYSVSVVAVPMDPYVKKNSATALAGSPVVTGAEQSKKYIVVFNSTTMQKGVSGASAYTSSWENISGGLTLNLVYFNNNNKGWSFVKCGRSGNASVGTITTTTAIPEAISKVTVTIDAITVSKVNSIKLYVDTVSSFDSVSLQTVNLASIGTGDKEFSVETPTANCYYKLEFDCASGSSNGLVTVSKIVYEE